MTLLVSVELSGLATVSAEELVDRATHADLVSLSRLIEARIAEHFHPLIDAGLTDTEKQMARVNRLGCAQKVRKRTKLMSVTCVQMVDQYLKDV